MSKVNESLNEAQRSANMIYNYLYSAAMGTTLNGDERSQLGDLRTEAQILSRRIDRLHNDVVARLIEERAMQS